MRWNGYMSTQKGCCCCGTIKYEIHSEVKNIVNCHCKVCRSHSGTSLSTYAVFALSDFEIVAGEEYLSCYKLTQATKHFCSNCGTPIYNLNPKYSAACIIYLGTLENCDINKPQVNIWYESKLSWINDIGFMKSYSQENK